METDWQNKMYVQSGEAMADLIVSAIGPVEDSGSDIDVDVMEIPDFIAGFIYQLTGDNDLTEIESCYQGGDNVVIDAEAALADIKSGKFISGVKDIGKIVNELPDALSTCEGMQDDIKMLEDYAKSFENVGHVAKEASKNWLLHGRKVKADIAQEKSDWAADKFFDAGKDTAAAIELLVPFNKNENEVGLDILGIPEFAAGFFYGMVGDNHLTEFQTCFQSSSELVHYAESFISELEDLKIIAAFEDFEKFLYHF